MKLHSDFKKTVITFSAAILLGTGVVGGVDVPGLSSTIAAASGAQVASQTDQKTQKELQALVAGVKEGTLLLTTYGIKSPIHRIRSASLAKGLFLKTINPLQLSLKR